MGFFDRFRSKAEEATEHAKSMLHGHKDKASDAMPDAGEKAAERMPGPSADAMGNTTQRAQGAGNGDGMIEQAEHDMESEGGHEPPM